MVNIEDAIIARLKRGGLHFEVLADPDKALEFKKGMDFSLDELVSVESIFRDARKGDLVSEEELRENFGTNNVQVVIKKILKEGDIQLTTEQKKRFLKEKRNKIANIIATRAVNPQTGLPHPLTRVLNAMEHAGVNIDPFKEAESQVDDVVKALKELLPIKFQRVICEITIPPKHVGKAYDALKRTVGKFDEKWLNDGSLRVVISAPAGIHMDIIKKIGDVTHGEFRSEVVQRVDL